MTNPNYGVFDLETFIDTDERGNSYSRVYALGFVTSDQFKQSKASTESEPLTLYYLTDHFPNTLEGSAKLVLKCLDNMLVKKYHNFIFYVHNLGRFDIIFIHKILLDYNSKIESEGGLAKYILEPLYRDNQIIRLIVKLKKKKEKDIKIAFVDSLNILNSKLAQLCIDYNVETIKGIFPYSFVNKDNLNYIGPVPDIKFYKNNIDQPCEILECGAELPPADWNRGVVLRSGATALYQAESAKAAQAAQAAQGCGAEKNLVDIYNSIISRCGGEWDLRKETLIYLAKDLNSLLEILGKFQEHLWLDHNLEMTEGLTIASLAKTKFFKYFLKKSKIPLINTNTLFNFIYTAYYGGITEVYKPHGINLTSLDVNSLYPYAAKNPMPGLDCI
jgi:hypothetical protein